MRSVFGTHLFRYRRKRYHAISQIGSKIRSCPAVRRRIVVNDDCRNHLLALEISSRNSMRPVQNITRFGDDDRITEIDIENIARMFRDALDRGPHVSGAAKPHDRIEETVSSMLTSIFPFPSAAAQIVRIVQYGVRPSVRVSP